MENVMEGFRNYDTFMPRCPGYVTFRVGEETPEDLCRKLNLDMRSTPPIFEALPNHFNDEWRQPLPEEYEPPAEYQHYLEKWDYGLSISH
jgi:hypothetical protein